jgi:hypothetical protein
LAAAERSRIIGHAAEKMPTFDSSPDSMRNGSPPGIRAQVGFAATDRREAPGLTREDFAAPASTAPTSPTPRGARVTSDRMRLPIPNRVKAASLRSAPWGRFPYISGRCQFNDDRDRPVPGISHTGAGRVASPRLGVGRSGEMHRVLRSVTARSLRGSRASRRAPDRRGPA